MLTSFSSLNFLLDHLSLGRWGKTAIFWWFSFHLWWFEDGEVSKLVGLSGFGWPPWLGAARDVLLVRLTVVGGILLLLIRFSCQCEGRWSEHIIQLETARCTNTTQLAEMETLFWNLHVVVCFYQSLQCKTMPASNLLWIWWDLK